MGNSRSLKRTLSGMFEVPELNESETLYGALHTPGEPTRCTFGDYYFFSSVLQVGGTGSQGERRVNAYNDTLFNIELVFTMHMVFRFEMWTFF